MQTIETIMVELSDYNIYRVFKCWYLSNMIFSGWLQLKKLCVPVSVCVIVRGSCTKTNTHTHTLCWWSDAARGVPQSVSVNPLTAMLETRQRLLPGVTDRANQLPETQVIQRCPEWRWTPRWRDQTASLSEVSGWTDAYTCTRTHTLLIAVKVKKKKKRFMVRCNGSSVGSDPNSDLKWSHD